MSTTQTEVTGTMQQRPRGEFTHIGMILRRTIGNYGQKVDENLIQIQEMWDSCVGREIAQAAQPVRLTSGRLLVHVNSSVWHHHLNFLKKELMEKVNASLGESIVSEIRFRISPI